ncbi:MAG TPA: SDR family NAD(P)-dependent oxidoreductase [Thiobacillus sp.]|nr:MAG: short-chain dehydrogenase [Hydrogenophilales bacterium 28-61-11]OYZ56063.1 MAG: short-chain dehydrogenase [Hydrogenophilales bacterium 16-61-112]OZA50982.1 MAG: short-chain dehydrogenase [Hydrogenophilales bacterium 17-61-76]HQT30733.1 SDR family NAD(P)-dependent oxidoreductase [Thiobacillus sp.]HQT69537.1 SDR family NAD(P)-dependent oxidoreductase [Thiobacillus sp.]
MSLNPKLADWRGQRVWLIGASSGIGEATARLLMAHGARVALTSRSRDTLEKLADGNAVVVPADVTDRASVSAAFDSVLAAFGDIDVAILNAGTHQPVRAWELDAKAAEKLVQVNLVGVINASALLAPYFAQRGSGRMAITASVAGYGGLPSGLVYGATKAALINFAETLYLDLAPKGVAVHLINPGFVKTPLTDLNEFKMPALIEADEAAREILAGIAAGAFEIHFPKRFTRVLKLLNLLPYRTYFPLVHRITGL